MGHRVRSGKSTDLLPVVGGLLLSAIAILTSCGGDEQPQLETEVTFTPNTETTKLQTLTTSASPTNSGTYTPPPSTSGVTPTTTTFVGTPTTTATLAPTTTTTPPVPTEPDQNAPGG